MWPSQWCQKSTSSASGIFVDICRGISEEEYQTSYLVKKLKNGSDWFFLCDTWSRCLEKLQFMLTETRQIWGAKMSLRKCYQIQWGKMLPSNKFSHFQYATLEIFSAGLNNYSMVKLRFFNQHPRFCNVL